MGHAKAASRFNKDEAGVTRHDEALWFVRQKRDQAAQRVRHWEYLRETAAAIKAHTLSDLDTYLLRFEENALKNGIYLHWAAGAEEHNTIVYEILKKHRVTNVVKSKSMLTEECRLNPFLEKQGIQVTDTDLGERIVQLAKEPPSHIVLPAIHKKKEDIDALFHRHLGTERSRGDPQYLTGAARAALRRKFTEAGAAITGVNFAIADTGGFVVCTNEGNADMGVHLAPVHIACMGIEKIIPAQEHLGIFLRLLARSATGQAITTYTSCFRKPAPGREMHIVMVDNGRTEQLGRPDFSSSLHCIRCGACLNTCPVYRRSGGHSYGATVPGPIGAILSPGTDLKKHADLPFASTLCGSCSDVCPVKIDIHTQLYKWRQVVTAGVKQPFVKRNIMKATARILARPERFWRASRFGRWFLKHAPALLINNRWNAWTRSRKLPEAPAETFAEWIKKNRGNEQN